MARVRGKQENSEPEERRRLPLRWAVIFMAACLLGLLAAGVGGALLGLITGVSVAGSLHAMIQ